MHLNFNHNESPLMQSTGEGWSMPVDQEESKEVYGQDVLGHLNRLLRQDTTSKKIQMQELSENLPESLVSRAKN